MKRFFLISFVAISVVELIALVSSFTLLAVVAKPLIIATLVGYYYYSTRIPKRSLIFLSGLLFCWAGDVLLLFQSEAELFFICGLFSFLVGHILYIITYRQHRSEETENGLLSTQKIRFSLPVILAGTGLVVVLFPLLGDLKIPVLIYAIVIIVMVMNALFRYGRTSPASFWMVFAGALLFQLSDSLLAINKFYAPFPFSDFWVMLTYIGAQYLIVQGVIDHTLKYEPK